MNIRGVNNNQYFQQQKNISTFTPQQLNKLQAILLRELNLKVLDKDSPEFKHMAAMAGQYKGILDESDRQNLKMLIDAINKKIKDGVLTVKR
ncbi:hypothetical protein IIE26_27470 (plasmid) [Cytobacillus oceanisediminis]|uniref:hypothetical protein n=1 Tax=Cytobacillus oceanisediminis TaxID=665099 RepID=UPI0018647B7F|nr:hypothetical protein [Cytobacillus oceanisediminis]QOK29871.1 hypothetical protein IIE26_27470 [Cytobacillus oceanisediminis]